MLAAVGKGVYAPAIENSYPILYRFIKGSEPIRLDKALPREIGQVPALPRLGTRSDYPLVMQDIEEALMPAGLYGWNDSLFSLPRA